jgi:hypothetical protein
MHQLFCSRAYQVAVVISIFLAISSQETVCNKKNTAVSVMQLIILSTMMLRAAPGQGTANVQACLQLLGCVRGCGNLCRINGAKYLLIWTLPALRCLFL